MNKDNYQSLNAKQKSPVARDPPTRNFSTSQYKYIPENGQKKTSKVLKNNPAKKRAYLVPSIYSVKYYKERRGELFILVLLFWTNFFKTEPPLEVIIRLYSASHSFHIFNENKREQLYTFV